MSQHVFRLHSTLELPLEDLNAHLDSLETSDLPPALAAVETTRRNNTLIIQAVAADDEAVSKYTPSAQVKAIVKERRIYLDEDEEPAEPASPMHSTPPRGYGQSGFGDEDGEDGPEERPSELVEYAGIKGELDAVLQNTAFKYEMFEVLRDIARIAESGELTAITCHDGNLEVTRSADGVERDATIEIVTDPRENESTNQTVNWKDNPHIN
jgi:hypothetical protein